MVYILQYNIYLFDAHQHKLHIQYVLVPSNIIIILLKFQISSSKMQTVQTYSLK